MDTMNSARRPVNVRPVDPDEINLLEYILVLVKGKVWIIGVTALGWGIGQFAALVKGPSWVSEAVIAPKENETRQTPSVSSFGAFGGLVTSQLNLGGNPGLDKINLALDSRMFNAQLIGQYNLLPLLYKAKWPKAYRALYDSDTRKWSPKFTKPDSLGMGSILKSSFLRKEIESSGSTMRVTITTPDSLLTSELINSYLNFLDTHIRSNVQNQAKANVVYIDSLLLTVRDPLVREKMQGMIANEIEKSMLVANEAFQIVDPPYQYSQFKEKKLYPKVFGAGFFFLSVLGFVVAHAFSSSEKTEEDRNLIAGIKRELRRIV